jgi:hypothetical protein
MNIVLIRIDAQDASGGAVPVRLASHDMPEACHLGGEQWDPALARLPDFALDFFGGAFSGQVIAPRTSFSVATIGLAAFGATPAARARFADARVRIWVGDITSGATADLGPLVLRFDGRITGEPGIDDSSRTASFDAAVQDSWADKPLLPLFGGTGGIEGPADLTGQPKPLVLGNARFCGGVLIDNIDNVWMVSHGPVQAVNAVYDRLASLGASAGNFANLSALKAASIPNGSWGTCLTQGLVRLGAPPDGRVSFDVSGSNSGTGGYVRRPGAIIRRIADIAGGTVNAASLAALDSARPYNLQMQLREQVTARDIIARIADSVGAVAGVSLRGELFAQALTLGSSGAVLNADDSGELRVATVDELAKAAPAWRLATEAELTFEQHSADEAAFSFRWQGEYSATRVYRIDDVVTSPDGAAWAYINAAPSAGQALPVWPVSSNAHWRLFQAPAGASIAPANANRVPFSRMEADRGWGILFNPNAITVAPDYGIFDGMRFFRAQATATGAGQQISIGSTPASAPAFRLTPGERISVQFRAELAGAAAATWTINLWGFRADGSQDPIPAEPGSTTSGGIRFIGNGFVQFFVTVPNDVIEGRLELYGFSSGAGSFVIAISEPMVTSAALGQTVHPPFSSGPAGDPNNLITVDGSGRIQGIGTGGVFVDNGKIEVDLNGNIIGIGPGVGTPVGNQRVIPSGLLSARPVSGQFVNQGFYATDTREIYTWDGFNWRLSSDLTATAQRSVVPQFPIVEIRHGEAGNVGTRTVLHTARRGTDLLVGGTYPPLPNVNLGTGTASVNAATGAVSLSNITQSGSFLIRYIHTDGIPTDAVVNVAYVPPPVIAGTPSDSTGGLLSIGGSSFVVVTPRNLEITLPSGVTTATLTASGVALDLIPELPLGATGVEMRWMRESSPGTWTAVGSVATASPAPEAADSGFTDGLGNPIVTGQQGTITCNRSATGLSAGSLQRFRLEARISSGNIRTVLISGTAIATS